MVTRALGLHPWLHESPAAEVTILQTAGQRPAPTGSLERSNWSLPTPAKRERSKPLASAGDRPPPALAACVMRTATLTTLAEVLAKNIHLVLLGKLAEVLAKDHRLVLLGKLLLVDALHVATSGTRCP